MPHSPNLARNLHLFCPARNAALSDPGRLTNVCLQHYCPTSHIIPSRSPVADWWMLQSLEPLTRKKPQELARATDTANKFLVEDGPVVHSMVRLVIFQDAPGTSKTCAEIFCFKTQNLSQVGGYPPRRGDGPQWWYALKVPHNRRYIRV